MPKFNDNDKYKVVYSPATEALRTFLFKDGEMIAAFMGRHHAADCQRACDALNTITKNQDDLRKITVLARNPNFKLGD